MNKNKPFNKDKQTKVSFSELMDLIGTTCDYKFCIVDENIDEELMELAAKHGIDLTGYKHVIETSGVQHAEKRHGTKSNDRTPLTLEDYLMVPYIIKNRDTIEIFPATTTIRGNTVILYKKRLVIIMFIWRKYVMENIKAWHSNLFANENQKTPLFGGVLNCVIAGGTCLNSPLTS